MFVSITDGLFITDSMSAANVTFARDYKSPSFPLQIFLRHSYVIDKQLVYCDLRFYTTLKNFTFIYCYLNTGKNTANSKVALAVFYCQY